MNLSDNTKVTMTLGELKDLLEAEAGSTVPKAIKESIINTLRGDITRVFQEALYPDFLYQEQRRAAFNRLEQSIEYIEKRLGAEA